MFLAAQTVELVIVASCVCVDHVKWKVILYVVAEDAESLGEDGEDVVVAVGGVVGCFTLMMRILIIISLRILIKIFLIINEINETA